MVADRMTIDDLFFNVQNEWYVCVCWCVCNGIIFSSYSPRMRLCSSVTDAEVERAKNVFKTSLFMHLDGMYDTA